MIEKGDFLASPTNPNGMFGIVTEHRERFATIPLQDRVEMVIGDIYTFAVEVVGLDPEMAEIVTARAVTELSVAMHPEIAAEEYQDSLVAGLSYGREQMVDRAITNILD